MTIEILETRTENDFQTGQPVSRWVRIAIDGWDLPKGGLPLAGNLQTILNAQEAELLAIAQARNIPVPEDIKARSGAKQWFIDNPNAMQIFTLSIADLQTEIYTLVDAIIPTATAGNRTRLKLLLMGLAVAVRVLVKRELS